MSIQTPPVDHLHVALIGFLEPWQSSNRPESWFDWGTSFFQTGSQPAVVHHHHHHNYSLLSMGPSVSIGSNNVTVVNNDNRSKKKDTKIEGHEKPSIPSWVLPVAVIIAVAAAVFAGAYGKAMRKAEEDLAYTKGFWLRNPATNFDCKTEDNCTMCFCLGSNANQGSKRFKFEQKVASIFCNIRTLQENDYNKQWDYTWGARGLLASSCVVATGALMTVPWLVTAGSVAGLISLVYLAHAAGTHWSDSQELDSATTNDVTAVINELNHPTSEIDLSSLPVKPPIVDQSNPLPTYDQSLSDPAATASIPPSAPPEAQTLEKLKERGDNSTDSKLDCVDATTSSTPTHQPTPPLDTDELAKEITAIDQATNTAAQTHQPTTNQPTTTRRTDYTEKKTSSPHNPSPSAPSIGNLD